MKKPRGRRSTRPGRKQTVPVFPSGIEWDAIPKGARDKPAVWKRPAGPARLTSGHVIELPEGTMEVDLESAIEQEANLRLTKILASGKLPSAEDFARCATKPPMSGSRLLNLVLSLSALSNQQWHSIVARQKQRISEQNSRNASRRRNRPSKWEGSLLKTTVEKYYREWRRATKETRAKHGELYDSTLKRWAREVVKKIKASEIKDRDKVNDRNLLRSILPKKDRDRLDADTA